MTDTKMSSKEATKARILLERKGWSVRNGKFIAPANLLKIKEFSTEEAIEIQKIFGTNK